jgi:2,3-bisphosphoglycerate-independent phosphoglycerate mutase
MQPTPPKPIVLIILDGFGIRKSTEANAITAAHTPVWDQLWQEAPHTTLLACGPSVGLPEGQMGNSEVGHLTMGAGRIVNQDLTRINHALKENRFNQIPALNHLFHQLQTPKHTLHILGLLSPGGVHSDEAHIQALIQIAVQQGVQSIFIHAFLDGRDTPPQSAKDSLLSMQTLCKNLEKNDPTHTLQLKLGSLCGRYYAMDRDKRYERTQMAYELLTNPTYSQHLTALDPIKALENAYNQGETDEFVRPIRLVPEAWIHDKEAVIFMNFRSDRTRQLSYALTDPDFQGFQRTYWPQLLDFITLTEYDKNLKATVLFPPQVLNNMLGAVLEQHHLKQLRLAETEKYAHVTFFLNGGQEMPFIGESRILIPSPKVSTYDQQPAMSAIELTDCLVQSIENQSYDLIICNYANADMLGHTGNFRATVQAIEVLDQCLGRVLNALHQVNAEAIITADHGNADCMVDPVTQQPHTAHTHEPVPFVYIGHSATLAPIATTPGYMGKLYDIAPTLLTLLNIPIPQEMQGISLLIQDKPQSITTKNTQMV